MFGIGMPEMILILAVALIVVGPKKLPELAKSMGKAMGEFKKATNNLKESIKLDSDIKNNNFSINKTNNINKKHPTYQKESIKKNINNSNSEV